LAALQITPCTKEIGLECKVEEALSINSVAQDNIGIAIDLRNDEEDIAITNDDESTGDVWVMHGKHSLKLVDKVAIKQDQELND